MVFTLSGMVRVFRAVCVNAFLPIAVTVFGIVTSRSEPQYSKADSPMVVTPCGMSTFSKLQYKNASLGISVTPLGMVSCFIFVFLIIILPSFLTDGGTVSFSSALQSLKISSGSAVTPFGMFIDVYESFMKDSVKIGDKHDST